jgi:hypothetical protein
LGQLVSNAAGSSVDVFYIHDEELERELATFGPEQDEDGSGDGGV